MIKCPYCDEVLPEPEDGLPDSCPSCLNTVTTHEWEYLHAE